MSGEFVQEYAEFLIGKRPVVAPNNGPTWSQQNKNCLNTINNTPDGKFYNTFSYTSALIGPDASLLAAGQDAASEGAQRGALGFLKGGWRTLSICNLSLPTTEGAPSFDSFYRRVGWDEAHASVRV
jgi:hypothetical protein